jgi:ADP-ribose pyrophosphatase
MVLIEQYRHGSNTVELEIPGGNHRRGGRFAGGGRSPGIGGGNRLSGEPPVLVGHVFPNPAIMRNHCYTVLVRNCRLVKPVQLDEGEDLATKLVPLEQVPELVASGQIRHSLVVAALYQFDLWWKKNGAGWRAEMEFPKPRGLL